MSRGSQARAGMICRGGSGMIGAMGHSRFRVSLLASALMAAAAALVFCARCAAAGALAAESKCGPFGDPPAEVQHGPWANAVSDLGPRCFGGQLLGPWKDPGAEDRYACRYAPDSAGRNSPIPLVIFLHGSIANADSIRFTGLPQLVAQANLGGPHPGFILVAPEGRYTTHFYPGFDGKGLGWDNWYRQLDPAGAVTVSGVSSAENADAATIDHFIEQEISSGKADRKRVYLMGWSNGAAMAMLYALSRPVVATAAVYSAPDPFGAFDDLCKQTPVAHPAAGPGEIQLFNPQVPIMHVRNACDIGGICPNGDAFAKKLRAIGGRLEDVVIDQSGKRAGGCDPRCGTDPMGGGEIGFLNELRGLKNHLFWPRNWNDRMLDFLRSHPLKQAVESSAARSPLSYRTGAARRLSDQILPPRHTTLPTSLIESACTVSAL
ncbi:MAG: PHB depolymerase family esterase [Candidatus Binataceae bacterium]